MGEETAESSVALQRIQGITGLSIDEALAYNFAQFEKVKRQLVELQREVDEYEDAYPDNEGNGLKPQVCISEYANASKATNTKVGSNCGPEPVSEASNESKSARCMWDELPVELFDQIIGYLPLYAIDSLRYVNKSFFRHLSKPVYVNKLYKMLREQRSFYRTRNEYMDIDLVEQEIKMEAIQAEVFTRATWRYPTIKLDWDFSGFGEDVTVKVDGGMLIIWSLEDPGHGFVDRVVYTESNLWLYSIEDGAPRFLASTRTSGLVYDVVVHYGTQQDSIKIQTKFDDPFCGSSSAVYQLCSDFSTKRPMRNPLGIVDYKRPQRKGYEPTYSLRKLSEFKSMSSTRSPASISSNPISSGSDQDIEIQVEGQGQRSYKTLWDGSKDASAHKWIREYWKPTLSSLRIIQETKYKGPNNEPQYTLFLAHAPSTNTGTNPTMFASIFTTENSAIGHISVTVESNRPFIPLFPEHKCNRIYCHKDCTEASNGPLLARISHPDNGTLHGDEISPGNISNSLHTTTYIDVVFSSASQVVRIFRISFLEISRLLQAYSYASPISPSNLNLTERFTIRTKIITHMPPSKDLTIRSLLQVRYPTGAPVLYISCVTTPSLIPLEPLIIPGRTGPGSGQQYDKTIKSLSNVPSPVTPPIVSDYLALKDAHRRQSARTTSLQIFICDEATPSTTDALSTGSRFPLRCQGRSMDLKLKFTGDEGVLEELGIGWGSRWDVRVDLPEEKIKKCAWKRIEGFGSGGEVVDEKRVDRSGKGGRWWSRLFGM